MDYYAINNYTGSWNGFAFSYFAEQCMFLEHIINLVRHALDQIAFQTHTRVKKQ